MQSTQVYRALKSLPTPLSQVLESFELELIDRTLVIVTNTQAETNLVLWPHVKHWADAGIYSGLFDDISVGNFEYSGDIELTIEALKISSFFYQNRLKLN